MRALSRFRARLRTGVAGDALAEVDEHVEEIVAHDAGRQAGQHEEGRKDNGAGADHGVQPQLAHHLRA